MHTQNVTLVENSNKSSVVSSIMTKNIFHNAGKKTKRLAEKKAERSHSKIFNPIFCRVAE